MVAFFQATTSALPLLLCSGEVVLVSVSTIVLLVLKEGSSLVYADDIWKPSCHAIHPSWLLGFRSVAFLYASAILATDIYSDGLSVFYFYTQWAFLLLIIYFGIASMFSLRAVTRLANASREDSISFLKGYQIEDEENKTAMASLKMYWETIVAETEQLAPFSGFLVQVLFQTLAGAAVLTDLVYWLGIFPVMKDIPRSYDFLEVNLHGVNCVLLLVEMSLNRMSFPWYRGAYFTLWSAVYVLFQWSVHALGMIEWWPYPFLDPTQRFAPVWYAMLCAGHVLCYGVLCSIESLKRRIFRCYTT